MSALALCFLVGIPLAMLIYGVVYLAQVPKAETDSELIRRFDHYPYSRADQRAERRGTPFRGQATGHETKQRNNCAEHSGGGFEDDEARTNAQGTLLVSADAAAAQHPGDGEHWPDLSHDSAYVRGEAEDHFSSLQDVDCKPNVTATPLGGAS